MCDQGENELFIFFGGVVSESAIVSGLLGSFVCCPQNQHETAGVPPGCQARDRPAECLIGPRSALPLDEALQASFCCSSVCYWPVARCVRPGWRATSSGKSPRPGEKKHGLGLRAGCVCDQASLEGCVSLRGGRRQSLEIVNAVNGLLV